MTFSHLSLSQPYGWMGDIWLYDTRPKDILSSSVHVKLYLKFYLVMLVSTDIHEPSCTQFIVPYSCSCYSVLNKQISHWQASYLFITYVIVRSMNFWLKVPVPSVIVIIPKYVKWPVIKLPIVEYYLANDDLQLVNQMIGLNLVKSPWFDCPLVKCSFILSSLMLFSQISFSKMSFF